MTETIRVPAFMQGDLQVHELFLLTASDNALAVCPSVGTTLAMKRSAAEQIISKTIPESLAFLLVQRGMAQCEGSRPASFLQEEICPTFFLIDLTKSCNLRCAYCFRELDRHAVKMTEEKLADICDRLVLHCRQMNGQRLTIQAWGGEPLLEASKIQYIRKRFDAEGLNPQIVIETNATLITEETASLLLQNRIDIGISIDGPACIHNIQRPYPDGSPSLNAVKRGIENLRKIGYNGFGSITVVTRETYSHLPEVIDYLACTLHLRSIKLNLMRKTDDNREMAIDLSDIAAYVELLLASLKKCQEKGVSVTEQNVSQRMANLLFRPCDNICNAHGCHGGYRMLSIDGNGDVYPCELTDDPSYRLGNVQDEQTFEEMIHHAMTAGCAYFQARECKECHGCPWWFFCRGGCKAAAKYNCGDPRTIDRTECVFNQALYPRLAEILLNDPLFAEYLLKGAAK